MEQTKPAPKPGHWLSANNYLILKYIVFGFLFTGAIFIFSMFMSFVSGERQAISESIYSDTAKVYNGPLTQAAPSLGSISAESSLYAKNELTPERAQKYAENTALVSTTGKVVIDADFIKKGLIYQPTYRTQFSATYVLKNDLTEDSFVQFKFPFPDNLNNSEISNAKLIVDGKEITNAKTSITTTPVVPATNNDYYYDNSYYPQPTTEQGLAWEGSIPKQGQVTVEVNYNTVGLSLFNYDGIENPKGSQDFNFVAEINGIRSYDVLEGLSVDKREFGNNSVTLAWNKENLYSSPHVSVSVGDKLNPSTQVSRVYRVMAPVYVVAIIILLFLAYKFGKPIRVFDMFMFTILYILYYPFVHYLSSFTIDPTVEFWSNLGTTFEFSMPLYGAFAIAWLVIGSMMYYMFGRLSGFGFATKFVLPSLVLFLAFFPLVITIPEYAILLTLVGIIALAAIIIESRLHMLKHNRPE